MQRTMGATALRGGEHGKRSMTTARQPQRPVGELLREWRERRRLSQLAFAIQSGVSTRHLSFVETGRSAPSREMVLHLSEQLEVPLRERNQLLVAAGYAPAYAESALASPQMGVVRAAVRQVLAGHEPYPALAVDRNWNIVDANASIALFTEGAAAHLLEPPMNCLRIGLHPDGLAWRIVNLSEWRSHLLGRLQRQIARTGDPALVQIYDELRAYPYELPESEDELADANAIVVPLRIRDIRDRSRELTFFSTVTTFGTPLDITVEELSIESFFPADAETAAVLHERYASGMGGRRCD